MSLYLHFACVLSHSGMSDSFNPMAHQALLSLEFSKQEYWSGLPFLTPGEPKSPALAGRFFTTEPPGKPILKYLNVRGKICVRLEIKIC